MENKSINITTDRYPQLQEVVRLAEAEHRSLANMAMVLMTEAIEKRKQAELTE